MRACIRDRRWLLLSLALLAIAGFFLYPVLQNLSESAPQPRASAPPRVDSPPAQEPAPIAEPVRVPSRTTAPAMPIREVAPSIPEGIRNRIDGEIPIEVVVEVGSTGNVTGARILSATHGDSLRSYLAHRALEAVRQWKFRPARAGAQHVPAQWTVRFRFHSSGIEWD
jgi:periplasmic protein TonB